MVWIREDHAGLRRKVFSSFHELKNSFQRVPSSNPRLQRPLDRLITVDWYLKRGLVPTMICISITSFIATITKTQRVNQNFHRK